MRRALWRIKGDEPVLGDQNGGVARGLRLPAKRMRLASARGPVARGGFPALGPYHIGAMKRRTLLLAPASTAGRRPRPMPAPRPPRSALRTAPTSPASRPISIRSRRCTPASSRSRPTAAPAKARPGCSGPAACGSNTTRRPRSCWSAATACSCSTTASSSRPATSRWAKPRSACCCRTTSACPATSPSPASSGCRLRLQVTLYRTASPQDGALTLIFADNPLVPPLLDRHRRAAARDAGDAL